MGIEEILELKIFTGKCLQTPESRGVIVAACRDSPLKTFSGECLQTPESRGEILGLKTFSGECLQVPESRGAIVAA